jgi:CheY-like chemotaxis protein
VTALGRVLLVDDTETARYVQGTWLRRAGWEVDEAATGAEALSIVRPDHDVVILDVNLPDMSGLDVCAAIKSSVETKSVPVLHVSATATEASHRTLGLNNGADGYLIEPVEPDEFLASVAALARYHAANRRTERLAARMTMLSLAALEVNSATSMPVLVGAAAKGAASTFESAVFVSALSLDGLVIGQASASGAYEVSTLPTSQAIQVSDPTPFRMPHAALVARLPSLASLDASGEWYAVPIVNRQSRIGMVAVCTPSDWTPDDEITAEHFATVIAVAMENLRLARLEHELALTLQRSLLPARLPEAPGIAITAGYAASDRHAEVGGDFYDAFVLEDGRLALAIGDVQGHSLAAAAIMAELRYSARALVAEGHPLEHILGRLNVLMLDEHPDMIATMCLIIVAADRESFQIANAGHPPPLLITAGSVTQVGRPSPLLGIAARPHTVTTHDFGDSSSLLLFTDGLIERRDEEIDLGLRRVSDLAASGWSDGDELLSQLLAMAAGHTDDIAIVHVRRR